jgi:hypothetical protein
VFCELLRYYRGTQEGLVRFGGQFEKWIRFPWIFFPSYTLKSRLHLYLEQFCSYI